MVEILFISVAVSLLLTIAYGFVRKQNKFKSELRSARRIQTIAGLRLASGLAIQDALNEILSALSKACDASGGRLEFHAKVFGDFSCSVDEKNPSSSSLLRERENSCIGSQRRKDNGNRIAFVVEDDDFSCHVELDTNCFLTHGEYWNIQEQIRDKLSRCLLDKMSKTVKSTFQNVGIPCAIIDGSGKVIYKNEAFALDFHCSEETGLAKNISELMDSKRDCAVISSRDSNGLEEKRSYPNGFLRDGIVIQKIGEGLFAAFSPNKVDQIDPNANGELEKLLFDAIDDLNLGFVVLEKDDHKQDKEFKISSINKAFYRIFGLAGSNAQLEEVDEILSLALRSDGAKDSPTFRSTADFFYMRRDGIKVRARLTVVKAEEDSLVVVFEPVENSQLLISSYRQLIIAAENLFKTGDARSYLKELREATRSDGITLAEKRSDSSSFEPTEKAGFVINVPQLIFDDLPTRDLINYQGYLVVPMRQREGVTGALIALRPSEEEIELVIAGTRILEAHNLIKKEINGIHLQIAKVASEARRADSASRSKSEFLANMSHEIRTPLNSIIGFANIIHDESSDLSQELLHEFSGNIVAAGNHLLSLINDILDLTKVETGKMELDPQNFSVVEVVENIKRILKPMLDMRQIQLEVKIEDGFDAFVADPVKFKQILYNLLNNAITYSHGKSFVKLEVVRSADGMEMRIIDNGIGIKRDNLDKLFKPFVQLAGEKGGTGLGLVLTKKLVELHRGAIWVDSTFGAGTTVVVYLPEYESSNGKESEELSADRLDIPRAHESP
jgi:signal transduction histidine kinase/PAS domain-containing protein